MKTNNVVANLKEYLNHSHFLFVIANYGDYVLTQVFSAEWAIGDGICIHVTVDNVKLHYILMSHLG